MNTAVGTPAKSGTVVVAFSILDAATLPSKTATGVRGIPGVLAEKVRQRVESYLVDAIGFVVTSYGHEIAKVISQIVDRWDGKEAAERTELHVGRDLQFIRISGTFVGGLAGLAIYTLNMLYLGHPSCVVDLSRG